MIYIFTLLVVITLTIYSTLIISKFFIKSDNLVLNNKINNLENNITKYDGVLEKLDNQNKKMKHIIEKNSSLINIYNIKKKKYKKKKTKQYKVTKLTKYELCNLYLIRKTF